MLQRNDSPCSEQIWDNVMLPKFSALIPNLVIKARAGLAQFPRCVVQLLWDPQL